MELTPEPLPQMSVVLVTPDNDTIQKVIEHLRVQTVAEQLELVIVAPSGAALTLDAIETAPFHQLRLVEIGKIIRWRASSKRSSGRLC